MSKVNPPLLFGAAPPVVVTATAMWDFVGETATEVHLTKDEVVTVLSQSNDEWYEVQKSDGASGYAPSSYLYVQTSAPRKASRGLSSFTFNVLDRLIGTTAVQNPTKQHIDEIGKQLHAYFKSFLTSISFSTRRSFWNSQSEAFQKGRDLVEDIFDVIIETVPAEKERIHVDLRQTCAQLSNQIQTIRVVGREPDHRPPPIKQEEELIEKLKIIAKGTVDFMITILGVTCHQETTSLNTAHLSMKKALIFFDLERFPRPEQHAFTESKDQFMGCAEGLKAVQSSALSEWITGKTQLSDCPPLNAVRLGYEFLLNLGPMLIWVQESGVFKMPMAIPKPKRTKRNQFPSAAPPTTTNSLSQSAQHTNKGGLPDSRTTSEHHLRSSCNPCFIPSKNEKREARNMTFAVADKPEMHRSTPGGWGVKPQTSVRQKRRIDLPSKEAISLPSLSQNPKIGGRPRMPTTANMKASRDDMSLFIEKRLSKQNGQSDLRKMTSPSKLRPAVPVVPQRKEDCVIIIQRAVRRWLSQRRMYAVVMKYRKHDEAGSARWRAQTLREILSTEETYVRNLEIADEIFSTLRIVATANSQIIEQKEIDKICQNLFLILKIHQKFFADLKEWFRNWPGSSSVGELFLKFVPKIINLYKKYVSGFDDSNDQLAICANRPEFQTERDKISQTLLKKYSLQLDITAFLIMPVQRLPRYELLLRELVKTTDESHKDYPSLTEAFTKLKQLNSDVNKWKSLEENRRAVLGWQTQIKEIPKDLILSAPGRMLIMEGVLKCADEQLQNIKNFHCFLFNDMFVRVKEKGIGSTQLVYRDHCLFSSSDFTYELEFYDTERKGDLKQKEMFLTLKPKKKKKFSIMKFQSASESFSMQLLDSGSVAPTIYFTCSDEKKVLEWAQEIDRVVRTCSQGSMETTERRRRSKKK